MRYYCCNNCCCHVVFLVAAVVTGTLPNTSMFCWLPRTLTMCGHVCHGCQHEIYGFSKHLNFVICHTNGLPAWCRWWGWWRCCRRLWHCFTPSPIPKTPLHIAMCTLAPGHLHLKTSIGSGQEETVEWCINLWHCSRQCQVLEWNYDAKWNYRRLARRS